MKTRTAMKRWAIAISIMILGGSISACATGGSGTNWKEEVLLHDGGKIIVERTAKRYGRHEIGQRPPIGDQSVSFTMPRTNQRVVWKDEYSEDVSGANFNLMMLDIVQGTPYLLATPAGCLSYNKWGRPNPPYVIFKYQGGEWQRISLQELPAGIKLPNMLHASPDDVAEKNAKEGVVPATVIREENEGYRQPEFRTILREAVPSSQLCPPELAGFKAPFPIPPKPDSTGGKDMIWGAIAADQLYGGDGDDWIMGNIGADYIQEIDSGYVLASGVYLSGETGNDNEWRLAA